MQLPRTNKALLFLIAAVCAIAVVLFVVSRGPDRSTERLEQAAVSGEATPTWTSPAVAGVDRPSQSPDRLNLYLDVSAPMAGFIPIGSRDDGFSALRSLAQVAADHLGRTYGRPGIGVTWRGVADVLRDIPATPRIERVLFNGSGSRLDLAVREALTNLRSGQADAAVLVTDLMSTGETTGPLGLARELSAWLASTDVRSGEFHLGLLGVKAEYWGATDRRCPEQGGLGCWFSERRPGYRRLDQMVRMPIYVVVLGRQRDKVEAFGQAVLNDLNALAKSRKTAVEARWELLTGPSRRRPVTMSCRVVTDPALNRPRQFAILRSKGGDYRCVRREAVSLQCTLESLEPQSVKVAPIDGADQAFSAAIRNHQIDLGIACGPLVSRDHWPPLQLDLVATATATEADAWASWSSETDELAESLGRTLQLKYFVEEVRLKPDSYAALLPPLFPVAAK